VHDSPETGEVLVVSVQVPLALRPWVELATKLGDGLEFPAEAAPKLAVATAELVAKRLVALPRDALGAEQPFAPRPALRIEWDDTELEGPSARVEAMLVPAEGAPFLLPGQGARLFTYVRAGAPVFVDRLLEDEAVVVREALGRIDAPIAWAEEQLVGRTSGLEDTLALAQYLDANPLKLPIEVKVGQRPELRSWPVRSDLVVGRRGAWLEVRGGLEIDGHRLSIGEVLEAARLAHRYVRVSAGLFLQLSQDVITKLQPLAAAAELARERTDPAGDALVHDAFGSWLASASSLFSDVKAEGLDLDEYRRRLVAASSKNGKTSKTGPRAARELDDGELRPYQREAVQWMLRLAIWAPGCVLADDMGLGKTVQTAAVLKARAKLGPALVVAPASVSSNWVGELRRFVKSLRVHWYNADRAVDVAALGPKDVLVVSYGLLQRPGGPFAERRWSTVVVDEAQYVKNRGAQRSDAVRSLERDFTVALTGTPLENHLGELFSIVDIVFPGLLGTEASFSERFRRPIESYRDVHQLAILGRLLAPFLLRRTRATVLADLPPREEITEYLDLAPEERRRYLALRRACEKAFGTPNASSRRRERRPYGDGTGDRSAGQLRIELLAALTRLRQLACDVRLVDPTYDGTSTKVLRTVELARELRAEGNRALVFSQFTQFLDKVRAALEAEGLRVGYLTGETPTTARQPLIDAFQAGAYDVFCISLLAGGTGLNLTNASYVIHLDPWWNPASEEQATSRAHRYGQTQPVTVYRLVARGTIEEAVLELHASKRDLASAVLDGKATAKNLSPAELFEILRFGGD
jgi:superfamily II DNA or RNA helicase